MNDWMIPSSLGTTYFPVRPRQSPFPRRARKDREISPLHGCGRRWNPLSNAPGIDPKGALFHAWLGPQQARRVHGRCGRVSRSNGPARRKTDSAKKAVPAPVFRGSGKGPIGLVTVGGCHSACVEALDILAREGVDVDYMRVRGFPFGDEVRVFLESHQTNFIVEQNRDAQLRSLLLLETNVCPTQLQSILQYPGYPMSAKTVTDGIRAKTGVAV